MAVAQEGGSSASGTARRRQRPRRVYELTSSEATDGANVVLIKQGSAGLHSPQTGGSSVIWTKTRELTDNEMVDTVHDSSGVARWTIHRPRQGWYLFVQPCLPGPGPGASNYESDPKGERIDEKIDDGPVLGGQEIWIEPDQSEGSEGDRLRFELDSYVDWTDLPIGTPQSQAALLGARYGGHSEIGHDKNGLHGEVRIDVDSETVQRLSQPRNDDIDESATQVRAVRSHFRVDPGIHHLQSPEPGQAAQGIHSCSIKSLFHRVTDAISSLSSTARAKSFSICWIRAGEQELGTVDDNVIVQFEEHRSLIDTSTSGRLILDPELVDASGVDPSGWVALALAVLEFEHEREGWRAANRD